MYFHIVKEKDVMVMALSYSNWMDKQTWWQTFIILNFFLFGLDIQQNWFYGSQH